MVWICLALFRREGELAHARHAAYPTTAQIANVVIWAAASVPALTPPRQRTPPSGFVRKIEAEPRSTKTPPPKMLFPVGQLARHSLVPATGTVQVFCTISWALMPPVAAVVWTVLSGNLKPPDADWMVPEQLRLPGTVPPEMSQPVVRSGEVRKRKPPEARTTNELSTVAWTTAPDADVDRSP